MTLNKYLNKVCISGMILLFLTSMTACRSSTAANTRGTSPEDVDDLIYEMISNAIGNENGAIEEELEAGLWSYQNGASIAFILPISPTKVFLSRDNGTSWTISNLPDSDTGFYNGENRENIKWSYGGYIGFNNNFGYAVLVNYLGINTTVMRIYITEDDGESWSEINNPSEVYPFVVTGAGFASPKVGFVSYRYYVENGPIIWWTKDGGETWERLDVQMPKEYCTEDYKVTPGIPVFSGQDGEYPLSIRLSSDGSTSEETIYMYSHDGGMTWGFEE